MSGRARSASGQPTRRQRYAHSNKTNKKRIKCNLSTHLTQTIRSICVCACVPFQLLLVGAPLFSIRTHAHSFEHILAAAKIVGRSVGRWVVASQPSSGRIRGPSHPDPYLSYHNNKQRTNTHTHTLGGTSVNIIRWRGGKVM